MEGVKKYGLDCNSTSIFVDCGMKYRVYPEYVEHKKIIIENEDGIGCLCRVDVNEKLFKLVYLEPHSVIDMICDVQTEDMEIKVERLL